MNPKKISLMVFLFALILPMTFNFTNVETIPEKHYVDVDYIWEGFFPHPVVADMQVQLFEKAFAEALEYGIRFTLRPEVDIDTVLASGDYDLVNYYRPRMPGDSFELILFTLDDMFMEGGLIHHKCTQLTQKITKLQRIYDRYVIAEGEQIAILEGLFLKDFHKIEWILYENQLVFDYCYFPPPEAPVIFVDKMSVINSAPDHVFSNRHIRLGIAKVFDRDFVCEMVQIALDIFGLQATQSYHLFGWSQYHDTILPEGIP
ncbi:MAG: hypothetical protein ACTSPK_03905 [Candidatus Heimdallarchaeota archaeon]